MGRSGKNDPYDDDDLVDEDPEEIFSVGSEPGEGAQRKEEGAVTRDLIGDGFFQLAEGQNKTPDERRLEMTKKLIEDVKQTVNKKED